mgnify:CR=1 FL=1
MEKFKLAIGIHNHQPVGNFDYVIEEAHNKAYKPFLELAAEFKPLRLMNGLYLQLHAYMLRVAIPYGALNPGQMRQLAMVADRWDKGYGHFTTRQNIQYNWPKLQDVPDMLEALARLQRAWEDKKDKVCQMPGLDRPQKGARSVAGQQLRSASIKVRPRQARKTFETDNRWRPVRYVTNDFQATGNGTVANNPATMATALSSASERDFTVPPSMPFPARRNARCTQSCTSSRVS